MVFVFSGMKKSGLDPGRSTPYFFSGLAGITKAVENDWFRSSLFTLKSCHWRQLHFFNGLKNLALLIPQ